MPTVLAAGLWLLPVFWAVRILLAALQRRSTPRLPPFSGGPAEPPELTVVIPMRNEAANARPCLEAVLAQNYPRLEVIVIDDDSTDGTATVLAQMAAADRRLRTLPAGPLPEGWLGKPHACWVGGQAAGGTRILFLDADTRLKPGALRRAVALIESEAIDLLSAVPQIVCGSFWERAVQPVLLSWLGGFVLRRANDPAVPDVLAAGPFLLFRRRVYEGAGTFAAVRGELLEDLAMARRVKGRAYRYRIVYGPELYALRMYDGLAGIWRGWVKTFSGELRGRPAAAVCLAAFLIATSVAPLPVALAAAAGLLPAGWNMAAGLPAAAAVVLMLVFRALSNRAYGLPAGPAWTHPLAKALIAAMFLAAAGRRPVAWKGRRIEVPPAG